MKYKWASDWYRQAMNNFWIPEEINLSQDLKDYGKLDNNERMAYDKILSFLIFLDSIQTANLSNINNYVTASEINLCLTIQACLLYTSFTCLILTSLITPAYATVKEDESQKIILIDPGHGGIDGGAKSQSGTIEKDINLQIALKLRDNLEEKGYKVCMTRESDEGLYQEGKTVKEKKMCIRDRIKFRCK